MRAQTVTTAAVTAAIMLAAISLTSGDAWAQASPADIQWAQDTLKSKGYDLGGRVSSKWTDGAKRALSNFQRANGLPATGELDAATMAKLGAARSVSPTMGTLGGPSQTSAAAASKREAPPQPKAAPTSRVGAEGGEAGVIGGVVLGHAPPPPAASAAGHAAGASSNHAAASPPPHAASAPHAAPAPRVQTQQEDAPSPMAAPRAQVMGGDGKAAGGVLPAEEGFQFANWMRYGVGGTLAATLGAIGFGWWRSGRRKAAFEAAAAYDDDERRQRHRVEPSFGAGRESKSGLPPLTAPARSRQ